MPDGFRLSCSGRLLDDEIVLDVFHAGHGGSVFAGGKFLVGIVHKAAQLHHAFDGLNFDLKGLNRFVAQKGALHLGRDDRIVHILTGAIAGSGRCAATSEAADQDNACQGEQESECR